ncbi:MULTISPECIES: hypothetical protein [Demequina]|uniref:Uncharacterized protein n=1 Tax=Demequina litorisediminis TaxID=1849022 RepID=A0ABQ6IFF1_9MICO|nr:hypothetical protein [Demequina litorisediminis]GMA36624.1 hypothetical protein GCM10025876_28280 [Demequina litorisediminis]
MDDPTDKDIHEGTAALQELAEEVEAERASGNAVAMPNDSTPEDDGDTREDHEGEDTPLPTVPPGAVYPNGRT